MDEQSSPVMTLLRDVFKALRQAPGAQVFSKQQPSKCSNQYQRQKKHLFQFNKKKNSKNLIKNKIMVKIQPDEISSIIRQQIEQYNQEVKIVNVGTVFQVGDGIARIYGVQLLVDGFFEFVYFQRN
eukprot:TRINITY_DN11211_c0_g1_i2.p3 TRINITY_DN11211_c0_g1~~TRINITY_DN11211_c0_g1_i2.p3  ORF type:complete len:126 (-),score=8.46 TRINITY_DN11211_c0_g1_i2:929-1306(-)